MKTDEPLWARIRGPLALAGIGALAVTAAVAAVGLPAPSTGAKPLSSAEIRALVTPTPSQSPSRATTSRRAQPKTAAVTPTPVRIHRRPLIKPTPVITEQPGTGSASYLSGNSPAVVLGSCTKDGLSRIHNWSPVPGYKGVQLTKSPARVSILRFTGARGDAPMEARVTCHAGQPVLTSVPTGPGRLPADRSMFGPSIIG
ncbi:hypothetical protein [Kribbella deserti]|uniref:Serine/threonine protein kinase n=1 Tax=Kribbella deserti TaxID=1926257 RepID=A0ABV6QG93_9ACTN